MPAPAPTEPSLSSTQIGAIAEATVACGLLLASKGQLAPYRPMADDDGLDLLLMDKSSRRIVQLQVKSRRKFDKPAAQRVEFDVRCQTFAAGALRYVLAVVLEEGQLRCAWLIPATDVERLAPRKKDKHVIVASAKPEGRDRFWQYRCYSYETITQRIHAECKASAGIPGSLDRFSWKPSDVTVEVPGDDETG